MFRILTLVLFSLLLISPVPALASPENARAAKQSGIEAFKAGNLEQAKTDFETAVRLGSTSRSLIYNLGVVYFKLEQYAKARNTFQKLIPTKQKALAYYNIGLVELALENSAAAKAAFEQVLASDPAENLQTLADAQLERLAPEKPPEKKRSSWIGLVSTGGGYQNNVALFPSSAPETIDSEFVEVIAAASGYLIGSARSGLRTNLSVYNRHYPSAQEFNLQVAKASARWSQRTGIGDIGIGAGGSNIWRDREQREKRKRLFTTLTLGACPGEQSRCALKLEAIDIDPEEEFEPYRGEMYRFETDYRIRLGAWTLGARYRLEQNDREDLTFGDEYFDLSPVRHDIRGTIEYPITPAWSIETEAEFRFSEYDRPHRFQTERGTIEDVRKDARTTVSLSSAYQFTRLFSLKATASYSDNKSNLERYEYDRQAASLSAVFKF